MNSITAVTSLSADEIIGSRDFFAMAATLSLMPPSLPSTSIAKPRICGGHGPTRQCGTQPRAPLDCVRERDDGTTTQTRRITARMAHGARGGGGFGTRPWWLALLACGGAYWPLALEPSAMTSRPPHCRGHPPAWAGGGGGVWHKASVSGCLPLAVPIGLSPLLILTLCGPERVLVVSTEPPDDLSCLTTPGVGRPGDGLLPVPLTRCIHMHTPSPCGGLPTPAPTCARQGVRLRDHGASDGEGGGGATHNGPLPASSAPTHGSGRVCQSQAHDANA